ncbi:hypothetical protein I552_1265 [Mycobacterium xenopi 3993]|nr:hypothetical protein I552_1265 [Mycobacterium xenopi 3993]
MCGRRHGGGHLAGRRAGDLAVPVIRALLSMCARWVINTAAGLTAACRPVMRWGFGRAYTSPAPTRPTTSSWRPGR